MLSFFAIMDSPELAETFQFAKDSIKDIDMEVAILPGSQTNDISEI